MLNLLPEVLEEYKFWCERIGNEDQYCETQTLGIIDVLRAHFLIVDFFTREGSGLGGFGPKSLDTLHSCLYRQFISLGGKAKWESSLEICATLLFGLIKYHPFHDANKRTTFLCCLYHLEKMGRCLTISEREFEDFTVIVADDKLNKFSKFRHLRKRKSPDAEVIFISQYLKKNSRLIDKGFYTISFRQLDSILKKIRI